MADDVVGFPLSDRPCALCSTPTVLRVCILTPVIGTPCGVCSRHVVEPVEYTYRVACCDGCAANLTEDKRMRLLDAARLELARGD